MCVVLVYVWMLRGLNVHILCTRWAVKDVAVILRMWIVHVYNHTK